MNIDLANFIESYIKIAENNAISQYIEKHQQELAQDRGFKTKISNLEYENNHIKKHLRELKNACNALVKAANKYCSTERYIFEKRHGRWRRYLDNDANSQRKNILEITKVLENLIKLTY